MRHMETNGDRSETEHATPPTGRGTSERYKIPDAAKVLNITEEAVRQRVKRGTLDSVKVNGSLFVLLNASDRSSDTSTHQQPVDDVSNDRSGDTSEDTSEDTSRLVDALESEIAHLRLQLEQANDRDRENRRIIAALTTRIPELPSGSSGSSSEPREWPMTASEEADQGRTPPGSQEPPEPHKRTWWQRFFGLD
jgi:hypothetical protein